MPAYNISQLPANTAKNINISPVEPNIRADNISNVVFTISMCNPPD